MLSNLGAFVSLSLSEHEQQQSEFTTRHADRNAKSCDDNFQFDVAVMNFQHGRFIAGKCQEQQVEQHARALPHLGGSYPRRASSQQEQRSNDIPLHNFSIWASQPKWFLHTISRSKTDNFSSSSKISSPWRIIVCKAITTLHSSRTHSPLPEVQRWLQGQPSRRRAKTVWMRAYLRLFLIIYPPLLQKTRWGCWVIPYSLSDIIELYSVTMRTAITTIMPIARTMMPQATNLFCFALHRWGSSKTACMENIGDRRDRYREKQREVEKQKRVKVRQIQTETRQRQRRKKV